MNRLCSIVTILAALGSFSSAFTTSQYARSFARPSSVALDAASKAASTSSVVIISPPGGVGEVSAVKAAEMGASVRWFVVSQTGNQQVVFAKEILDSISAAGGSVELAGADSASLLLSADDPSSAIPAVASWCGTADSIICTMDGAEAPLKRKSGDWEVLAMWKDAIKVAAKEASKLVKGEKIAILSALDDDLNGEDASDGIGGLVGKVLGGGKDKMPKTLVEALSEDTSSVTTLRHGNLFGIPESSPDFSPLVGGPRRAPELCEEYSMCTVRVDPTLSVSGNSMMGSGTRSSRHAVGAAAALMALEKVSYQKGIDVCVSSQRGTDIPSIETWQDEFTRVEKALSSGQGAQLFTAEFAKVPNVERLADWLATKWAPAVLRTYDIATIRSGARPVYATRPADGQGKVEIVWQQLVDFDSVTVGKMLIQVSDTGLIAIRGPGDASKGYGSISKKPLAGEDVLVRRLAEAASQAIEKGLATKKLVKKEKEVAPKPQEAPKPAVVTSVQAAGTVIEEKPTAGESGPRQAGARRSTERARGTQRKRSDEPKAE